MPQKINQADHQLNSAVGQKKTKKNSWVTKSQTRLTEQQLI